MTREKFVKYKFQAYERIDYVPNKGDEPIEMMLVSVNYDTEFLTLRPFPDGFYEQEDYNVHISFCEKSRPKLKLCK